STLPYKIRKMGYDVFRRVKPVIIHHEEDFSLPAWLKKKFNYGKTVQKYANKYEEYSLLQRNVFSRLGIFTANWRSFWSNPKLALGVILLKTMEYLAANSGLVVSKLALSKAEAHTRRASKAFTG
ncbi:MAG: hypothetical protein QXZ70_09695, partial [Candidatus Bathyarchaeia archaeon]